MREVNPVWKFADAGTTLILLILLLSGVDTKWILAAFLLMVFISELCKAFCAVVDPLIAAARQKLQ